VDVTQRAGGEQTALWNGSSGNAWAALQETLDSLFSPFEPLLAEAVPAGSAHWVLDVGCGAGSTTRAAARRLGAEGCAIGIDISEPLITAARSRADRDRTPARFILGDAQTHEFEPARFDVITSRFGVMFFDDSVAAFANLRRAARDNAELRFIAWRSPSENVFMTTAERAAAPLLPNLPAPQPDAPGQFGFQDPSRIRTILEQSGWTGIDIRPIDVACVMPEKDLPRYLTLMGPVGRVMQGMDSPAREQILDTVLPAFAPYLQDGEVRFTAACWMVIASNHTDGQRNP
jgi:SAM-dependent methyltransferase